MSTYYRPAPLHLSSYVVFAVLATVVALAITVLQAGPSVASHQPTSLPGPVPHAASPDHHCFAMPHYPTIELSRSGCLR